MSSYVDNAIFSADLRAFLCICWPSQNDKMDKKYVSDQQALLNFYSGAVEKSTQVALELIESVYQQAPKQRYFVGCSTGGREAMTMSQRRPDLYNGMIVGAPARQTHYSEIADLWSAQGLGQASRDQNSWPFSATQQQAIVAEVLAQCDAKDGLADPNSSLCAISLASHSSNVKIVVVV